ncbi:FGGY family carbohydrate kinase [Leucobacter luti]|uniref:FGGY family carbohydrate kinase n=1 Tax=Leucobacter luti TaxID=340320 RepID=UPI003CFF6E59
MELIAGLDFGTSSVKLAVVTPDGEVLARAHADYPTRAGHSGEMEQDPGDWWEAARRALAETGLGQRLGALGLTGQMQDLIPVAAGRALRPALLYSDTRATAEHERLLRELPDWERLTGNQQDASNVAAKIAWLAGHEPETLAAAEHLLLGAPGFVAWRATGAAVVDTITASTTGLLGVAERAWLAPVARAAGCDAALLPRLLGPLPEDAVVGAVTAAAAAELGVPAGIPVVHAMGDAGSTTDGLVGSEPGDAYLYLGTTGWFAAVTEVDPAAEPSPIHSLVMPGWDARLRIGAVQSAGASANWARKCFLPGLDFATIETRIAARIAEPGSAAAQPLCLPGLGGERTPVRDADFRGAFIGVQEATGPDDFYLSVLMGVAMALRHAADSLGVHQRRIPLVGGAASSAAWRRILADVFDATIVTREANDPGTHSAARAAAAALAIPHRLEPLFTPGPTDIETRPSRDRGLLEPLIAAHRRLYDALAPSFHDIANAL